jgi:hypothetical protein
VVPLRAFRQPNVEFIYTEESTHDSSNRWWTNHYDAYEEFLESGSAGELGKSHGLDQLGFWQKILNNPSYDKFWQEQFVSAARSASRGSENDRAV